MSSLPAGWYKDPADPQTQRYWDGDGWLGKAIPADATPPDGPVPDDPEPAPLLETPPVPVPAPPPVQQLPYPPHPYGPMPPGAMPPGAVPPGAVPGAPGWQPPAGFVPYPVEARPHGFSLAGLDRRLAARALDILFVLLINVVVNGWFAYRWYKAWSPYFHQLWDLGRSQADASAVEAVGQPGGNAPYLIYVVLAIATLIWLAYEAPATAAGGQTLGKRIMRIKVVSLDSTEPLGFGRAFGRWARLGLWLPAWGCCGFGLLMQLIDAISPTFDPQLRQAFHDKSARTVVVALPPGDRQPTPTTGGGDASQGAGTGGTSEGR